MFHQEPTPFSHKRLKKGKNIFISLNIICLVNGLVLFESHNLSSVQILDELFSTDKVCCCHIFRLSNCSNLHPNEIDLEDLNQNIEHCKLKKKLPKGSFINRENIGEKEEPIIIVHERVIKKKDNIKCKYFQLNCLGYLSI